MGTFCLAMSDLNLRDRMCFVLSFMITANFICDEDIWKVEMSLFHPAVRNVV